MYFDKTQHHHFLYPSKEPWNYVEVAVIVTSTIAVTIYVAREFLSRYIMDKLTAQLKANDKGKV